MANVITGGGVSSQSSSATTSALQAATSAASGLTQAVNQLNTAEYNRKQQSLALSQQMFSLINDLANESGMTFQGYVSEGGGAALFNQALDQLSRATGRTWSGNDALEFSNRIIEGWTKNPTAETLDKFMLTRPLLSSTGEQTSTQPTDTTSTPGGQSGSTTGGGGPPQSSISRPSTTTPAAPVAPAPTGSANFTPYPAAQPGFQGFPATSYEPASNPQTQVQTQPAVQGQPTVNPTPQTQPDIIGSSVPQAQTQPDVVGSPVPVNQGQSQTQQGQSPANQTFTFAQLIQALSKLSPEERSRQLGVLQQVAQAVQQGQQSRITQALAAGSGGNQQPPSTGATPAVVPQAQAQSQVQAQKTPAYDKLRLALNTIFPGKGYDQATDTQAAQAYQQLLSTGYDVLQAYDSLSASAYQQTAAPAATAQEAGPTYIRGGVNAVSQPTQTTTPVASTTPAKSGQLSAPSGGSPSTAGVGAPQALSPAEAAKRSASGKNMLTPMTLNSVVSSANGLEQTLRAKATSGGMDVSKMTSDQLINWAAMTKSGSSGRSVLQTVLDPTGKASAVDFNSAFGQARIVAGRVKDKITSTGASGIGLSLLGIAAALVGGALMGTGTMPAGATQNLSTGVMLNAQQLLQGGGQTEAPELKGSALYANAGVSDQGMKYYPASTAKGGSGVPVVEVAGTKDYMADAVEKAMADAFVKAGGNYEDFMNFGSKEVWQAMKDKRYGDAITGVAQNKAKAGIQTLDDAVKVDTGKKQPSTQMPKSSAKAVAKKVAEAKTPGELVYGTGDYTYTGPVYEDPLGSKDSFLKVFEAGQAYLGKTDTTYEEKSKAFQAAQAAGGWVRSVWGKMTPEQRVAAIKDAQKRVESVSPSTAFFRYGKDFSTVRAQQEVSDVNRLQAQAQMASATAEAMKAQATMYEKDADSAWKKVEYLSKSGSDTMSNMMTRFVDWVGVKGNEKKTFRDYILANPKEAELYNEATMYMGMFAGALGYASNMKGMTYSPEVKGSWFFNWGGKPADVDINAGTGTQNQGSTGTSTQNQGGQGLEKVQQSLVDQYSSK